MKKKDLKPLNLVAASAICLTLLAGCGMTQNSGVNGYKGTNGINGTDGYAGAMMTTSSMDGYVEGDYYRTDINDEQVGYSYSFSAEGETKKDRKEMLSYYEELQSLVNDNDGYIENVNNDYTRYTLDGDDMYYSYISESQKKYSASGTLNFTIEIPDEKVDLITDSLEQFCKENNFAVTSFNQYITNYRDVTVVEDDGEYHSYDSITKKELEKRTKYADVRVNIRYNTPRSEAEKVINALSEISLNINKAILNYMGALIFAFISMFVLFMEGTVLYKLWKKMVYKHQKSKPEYYGAKHIIIDKKAEDDVKGE